MDNQLMKKVSLNPGDKKLIDMTITTIFKLGCYYKKLSEKLKNQNELEDYEKIYLINKTYIDNFKEKTNYNENIEYFNDINNEENREKLGQKLIKYMPSDLEIIINYDDLISIIDLGEAEENYQDGFDIMSREFLETLDTDFVEKDFYIKYYEKENKKIIQFSDNSKLLIDEKDGKCIYHAIPSPINKTDKKQELKKSKTFKLKKPRA